MLLRFPGRPRAARANSAILVLAAVATLGFPGCPDTVTGPGDGGGDPNSLTMSNCWPNDDGRYWMYATTYRDLVSEPFDFVPRDQVPATVTLAKARQLLHEPVVPASGGIQYLFGLQFNGMKTTYSGVTAQNLVESLMAPGMATGSALAASAEDRLLARIAEVRPDLRARIEARRPGLLARLQRAGPASAGELLPRGPQLIFGYAWIKAPAYIGTYGDVDTLLAWKFLESDIHPGHQFVHQLVPSLASDVWLRASVERRTSVAVPGGTVTNALEVLYLIDYGVIEAVDNSGNILGSFRAFDYGTVTYAPGVGPAKVYERHMGMAGTTLTHGETDLALNLQATGLPVRGLWADTGR